MDKYILGQSQIGKITNTNLEIKLNLKLTKNPYLNNIIIYGYIRDTSGCSIENTCIIFFNKCGYEMGKVYSCKNGFYSYNGLKYKTIVKIVVIKAGYLKYNTGLIYMYKKIFYYNLYIEKECKSFIITGHVKDKKNRPLPNITFFY